jgi:hypothetical protein
LLTKFASALKLCGRASASYRQRYLKVLATLIASTLEGSGMVSRLQRNKEPLDLACRHLEDYFETKVRAQKPKAGADKS